MNRLSSGGGARDGEREGLRRGRRCGRRRESPPPFTHSAAATPSNTTAVWTSAGESQWQRGLQQGRHSPAAAVGCYVGGVAGGAAWTSGLSPQYFDFFSENLLLVGLLCFLVFL